MKVTFGEYIRELRIQNKLTLAELASDLNIDFSTLSKIENNKRKVPEEILPKLSVLFNLDLTMLENELYSERVASMIYLKGNCKELLSLAEEKAEYYILKNNY